MKRQKWELVDSDDDKEDKVESVSVIYCRFVAVDYKLLMV